MKLAPCCSLALVALSFVAACHRGRDRDRRGESTPPERPLLERTATSPSDDERVGTAFLSGASWVANEVAIDRVARTRCARALSCDAIGAGKTFASGDACVREARHDVETKLRVSECPAGIDGAALDACLGELHDESCAKRADERGRPAACRADKLCLKVEMPHR